MKNMRVLAVDPGDKRIGLAISDVSGTIANPLQVIQHKARIRDAALIAQIAGEKDAGLIVVGAALDSDNLPTPRSRKAERLADAIKEQTNARVVLWDEYGSTLTARDALMEMGVSLKKRRGHHDSLAATVILQCFLDSEGWKKILSD
jgi:putative Holliday junction resolvase